MKGKIESELDQFMNGPEVTEFVNRGRGRRGRAAFRQIARLEILHLCIEEVAQEMADDVAQAALRSLSERGGAL